MSWSSSSYKPQVRQQGFQLPSPTPTHTNPSPPPPPTTTTTTTTANSNALYMPHNFLPDAFRKFPSSAAEPNTPSMDFSDELASLMAHSPPNSAAGHHPHHQSSHERSTQSPNPAYDDAAYPRPPPHNIFDISAPSHHHSANPSSSFSAPAPAPNGHFSLHHQQHVPDYPPHPAFNSTLPALNSSMRYDPAPPPDSYYPRHTPSPGLSRSRSRTRRKHSVSSTSPPPRPSAIVIPGGRINGAGGPASPLSMHSLSNSTSGWFIPSQHSNSANEYSLPTPDSLTHPFGAPAFPHHHHGANPSSLASTTNLGVSPSDVSLASPVDAPESKQAALANEKRRRRRESHNAVERRRRDNINEKISELATLIPECMLDPSAPATTPTDGEALFAGLVPPVADTVAKKEDGETEAGGVVKANKGMILRKSVEYIRYLQQLVTAQASRNRDLEAQLAAHRSSPSSTRTPSSNGSSSSSTDSTTTAATEPPLVLQDEGGPGFMDFNPLHGVRVKGAGFRGFELASMPEDMELDDARASPSASASGSAEEEGERRDADADADADGGESEERGRRRVRGAAALEDGEEQESEGKAMET